MAVVDEQGYVSIVGRHSDIIIRGGYKVVPRELEDILRTHPAVWMCAWSVSRMRSLVN